MSIKDRANQLIEEFSYFEDFEDKYSYILELGWGLPIIDEQYKTPEYRINGCQSSVWLHADYKDGLVTFTADSDAVITKGIIALLIKVYSNSTPEDILNNNTDFIEKIGLRDFLSPTRSNGLMSMVKQMKMYAYAFQQQ